MTPVGRKRRDLNSRPTSGSVDAIVRLLYGISVSTPEVSRRRISQMAARLRFMPGGSGWAPIVDVAGYAAQRQLVRPITLPLPAGLGAALVPRRARLPLLLLGAHAPPAWKNFSVAHELGHLTLHQGPAGDPHPRSTSRRTEWEADRFAIELLLPEVVVERYARHARGRIDDLAARLVVPPTVLRRRLRELGAARTPS